MAGQAAHSTSRLVIDVSPRFDGVPLTMDVLSYVLPAGAISMASNAASSARVALTQTMSITRLDFFASQWALRRLDGTWVNRTNDVSFFSARPGAMETLWDGVPEGSYDRLRFCVGVPAELNHSDPGQYPSRHPLNPNHNGLHWNWQGGYVFLALEGNWIETGNPSDVQGFSYHLATDPHLTPVEVPLTLAMRSDVKLQLALDVRTILRGKRHLEMTRGSSSTHSRTNDACANFLSENLASAFRVAGLATAGFALSRNARTHIEIGRSATPYRFAMAASFPRPNLPADNPLTEEGVALGRRLFFDPELSGDGSQSCASCHQPARAFVDEKRFSLGVRGDAGARNSMPLFNLAWKSTFFWDGRASSLREQVLQPIQNPLEMDQALDSLLVKLSTPDGEYPALFEKTFGHRDITADRVARALEQFLLTQVSSEAKFDRVARGLDRFTAQEERGFYLFHTEYDPRHEQLGADCFHCHGGPLFQNQNFANNGLGYLATDAGRGAVTGWEGDQGKFAVPSLRNVEVTGPYMHDGRFKTLEEVVEHYSTGVVRSRTLDPNLAKHPDGGVPLTVEDKQALVAFLRTLTDERLRRSNAALIDPR